MAEPTTITLKNLVAAKHDITLDHHHFRHPDFGFKRATYTQRTETKSGERGEREVKLRLPGSLTILPKGRKGDEVTGLPQQILQVTQVDNLIRAGKLKAIVEAPAAAPASAPSSSASAPMRRRTRAGASESGSGE